jgi:hypothetical protein
MGAQKCVAESILMRMNQYEMHIQWTGNSFTSLLFVRAKRNTQNKNYFERVHFLKWIENAAADDAICS